MVDSVMEAQTNLSEAGIEVEIKEAVADKGYHATDTLELADSLGIRTYIPEPKRKGNGKRNWKDVPKEKRQAVLNNRRRTRGERSKRLQRLRSERVERSFAHICETGGARRSWLCSIEKVQKRYLIAAVARNLGLVMRKLFNMGTARGQQAEGGLVCVVLVCLVSHPSPVTSRIRVWVKSCPRHRLLGDGRLTAGPGRNLCLFQRSASRVENGFAHGLQTAKRSSR